LGNKKAIVLEIQKYFPQHDLYIEPFFGAGGMFFNKPKAKYNILNDIDEDVYNLFRQLIDNKEELIKMIQLTPITEKQFKEWANGKRENSNVLNAVRFLILSNFGLYGKSNSLRIGHNNTKELILKNIEKTFDYIKDVYFLNSDFREVIRKLEKRNIEKAFIYCDPPYLDTDNNYSNGFTEKDSLDLFDMLEKSGAKFAISEFDHPFIINQAEKRKLNIYYVCNRKNIKNRRSEILITNYDANVLILF
jgi:DNA adenine methylase